MQEGGSLELQGLPWSLQGELTSSSLEPKSQPGELAVDSEKLEYGGPLNGLGG